MLINVTLYRKILSALSYCHCSVIMTMKQESVVFGSVRGGVHAPINSVSVPAPISVFPPVKPRSAVHTDRQNRIGACKAVSFVSDAEQSTWLPCFYLLCLLITRISSLDGNEICLTSALNDRPVPRNWLIAARPYLGTDN